MSCAPPATSTLPLPSSVPTGPMRAVAIEPAGDHVLVAGSNSWAEAIAAEPLKPPASRTLPLGSSVELCSPRTVSMLGSAVHVLAAGS